jgi:gephyrin
MVLRFGQATDPPGTYKVLTPQTHKLFDILPPNSIYRINTGGPLPAGADAVIMVEDTELMSVYRDPSIGIEEEREVKTLVQVPPFDNIRKPGSDVKKGELVMRSGDKITRGGGEIGTLAFIGKREVSELDSRSKSYI